MSIVTWLHADRPGNRGSIHTHQMKEEVFHFFTGPRPSLSPIHSPIRCILGLVSGVKQLGIRLTANFLSNSEVTIHGAIPEGLHGVVLINKMANLFLGALAQFRKASIIFFMSVRLSSYISVAPTGRITMKLVLGTLIKKSVKKIQIWLKFGKNIWHFT